MHKFYFKAFAATAAGTVLIMLLGLGAGYLLKGTGSSSPGSDTTQITQTASVSPDQETTETEKPTETTVSSTSGGIQIPGFEKLTFNAGTRSQTAKLVNPPENSCYFILTMSLPDGVEIYRSDFLKPGDETTTISLSRDVPAGVYENCVLRYDCYDPDTLQALNGATNSFVLEVK